MNRLTIVTLGALALNGCTGTHINPPAVCDGKHRRPANVYDSILPSLPVPLPASQQGTGHAIVAPEGPALSLPVPAPAPSPDAASAPAAPIGPGAMNTRRSTPSASQRGALPTYSSC
ncbi:MAG: hypothetical protein EOP64_09895 [Sphingomonas sp.]|nr:MAG: hypothetical protein EOP64_09895 [Sphingomonas sp.]